MIKNKGVRVMKKFIKIIALILSICALSMTVACGGGELSVGSQNMSKIMNAIDLGQIKSHTSDQVFGGAEDDIGRIAPLDFVIGNVYAQIFAKDGGRGVYYTDYQGHSDNVVGVVFRLKYDKQVSEPLDYAGRRTLEGMLVWNENTGNFQMEAKVYDGQTNRDYRFRLSNLSIDEYYNNGSFNATNCKVEDIETSHGAVNMLEEYVPFVVEGINKCLDVIDEVYSAKGYPIGK
jgi:hypothetical protein